MSAPIAKNQLSFELPKLSYVDTSWEERIINDAEQAGKPQGFANWLAGLVTAFRAWRERDAAMAELSMMTDRELMDIGLNRGDVARVFASGFRQEADGSCI